MHFKINKKVLLTPLTRAASMAASEKTATTILTELLFNVGSVLTIIGGDGTNYIKASIKDFEPIESGTFCIPAKKLQDIISKMGDIIEIGSDGQQTIIRSGKSKITLSGQDAEMYPELPQQTGLSIDVMGKDFKEAIKRTAFAVSDNESQPTLTGLKLSASDGILTFIGCDRHRLATTKIKCVFDSTAIAIVKGKELSNLEKSIDESEEISLTFGASYFFCKTSEFTFYSRIIDGSYPDTSKLIPQSFKTETTMNVDDFRKALERSLVVAKGEKTKVVTLTLSENLNVLEATTEGDRAFEELEVVTTGEAIKVSFNAEYVIQALKTLTTEKCTVHFTGQMQPFIIKTESAPNDIQLCLPYRTR